MSCESWLRLSKTCYHWHDSDPNVIQLKVPHCWKWDFQAFLIIKQVRKKAKWAVRTFCKVVMWELFYPQHNRDCKKHQQCWCGNTVDGPCSGLWKLTSESRLGFSEGALKRQTLNGAFRLAWTFLAGPTEALISALKREEWGGIS